jgi:vancomycin permeability regulator SanA
MRTALVFGYGQKANGDIDEQTKNRCDKAIVLYKQGTIERIFLTVSASNNGVPMAESMRQYLMTHGVSQEHIVLERRGGNTAGEMEVFLSCVSPHEKLLFISTWYHIARIIWLALWRIPLRRLSVSVSWKHAHFKGDFLMEFLKIANAVLRPYRSAKVLANCPQP